MWHFVPSKSKNFTQFEVSFRIGVSRLGLELVGYNFESGYFEQRDLFFTKPFIASGFIFDNRLDLIIIF